MNKLTEHNQDSLLLANQLFSSQGSYSSNPDLTKLLESLKSSSNFDKQEFFSECKRLLTRL